MDKRIKSGRTWQIEREIENKQFEIARIEGEIAHFNRRIARIAVEAVSQEHENE